MSDKYPYTYKVSQSVTWIDETHWQLPDTPFMDIRFWQALRDTKALGEESGWVERYILISNHDKLIAVLPVFIKNHHRGEFVFDHAWAEAFARYGFDYYPRLVTAAPYSPITGERFWVANGVELNAEIVQTALQGVQELADTIHASSWHGLYVDKETLDLADYCVVQNNLQNSKNPSPIISSQKDGRSAMQILQRQGCQFQWFNQHIIEGGQKFGCFEDFLSTLTAKKRKNIRQERKKISKQKLTTRRLTGEQITPEAWQVFYQCYAITYLIRGQRPYLRPEFFEQLGETMPEHLMLAQAHNADDEVVASALFLFDQKMLYGRYWGALAEFNCLHFELCYYQGIEFAIEQGLAVFDPGTQGEHKLVRGFVPTITRSIHQVYNEPFIEPIDDFCREERAYMAEYREQAWASLPFNVENMPEYK